MITSLFNICPLADYFYLIFTEKRNSLRQKFPDVRAEDGYIRIYDVDDTEGIVGLLMQNNFPVREIKKNKIGLEEYYIELMSKREA